MKIYQKQIGDGKTPNKYWVFQYDEKPIMRKDEDGNIDYDYPQEEARGGLVGEYKTWQEALKAVDKTYLPHVTIEDRISGVVYEHFMAVCSCCGHEEYEERVDIDFTRKQLGDKFI